MALRKFLILRRPPLRDAALRRLLGMRSGRLEGRTIPIQRLRGFPHSLESGNPGQPLPRVEPEDRLPWTPAFAGVTNSNVTQSNRLRLDREQPRLDLIHLDRRRATAAARR